MGNDLHIKYLAVSPDDLRWGLAVHSVGSQDIAPGADYPPSTHPSRYLFSTEKGRTLNEYQLLYLTRGRGRFASESTGRRWQSVSEGDLFLLFPGEWHSYRPDPDTGWKESWIGFSGEMIGRWEADGFFRRERPVFHVGLHEGIAALYREAVEAASAQESGFQQRLGGIVSHLLSLAFFYGRNQGFRASDATDRMNRAKLLIAEQAASITPQDAAKQLNMSYSHFRRLFRNYTGLSPARYILDVRMDKARELLTHTDLSVKEIAWRTGFECYEYFFSAFRHHCGRTPEGWRAFSRGNG